MSNLIIMPGDDASIRSNYAGRVLALNTARIKKFQTFGFYLGPNVPMAPVPPHADMSSIQTAVLKEDLFDVTDNANVTSTGALSPIQETADENLRKVFIGTLPIDPSNPASDARQMFVAIPRSAEEEEAYLEEIRTKGRIEGDYKEMTPMISSSGIRVTDLPEKSRFVASTRPPDTGLMLLRKAFVAIWRDVRNWWSR